MARRQTKHRRKRYEPRSAYAGDVRPTGIFSLFGDVRIIRLVFILMALALVAGGFAGAFGTGVFGGRGSQDNPAGFILPDDDDTSDATPQPGATAEARRYPGPPALSIDPEKTYLATIRTELGEIEVALFADEAPETVNNFVFLAQDGFYDGLTFYQIFPGFSAQAGDPACVAAQADGSACRGTGGPGYELSEEAPGPFEPGTLGMINGSQFFIALTSDEQFQEFTPFGQVVSGLDVAQQLAVGTEIQTIEVQEQ